MRLLIPIVVMLTLLFSLCWFPLRLLYTWSQINPLSHEIPKSLIDDTQRYIPLIDRIYPRLSDLISSLPQILGYEKRQHYIVLLQNNMELRPTGGFMGSFADFYLEKGKVTDLMIQDIYVPDGQIKGYVKEPDPIRKYLFNQEHPGWRLRDSNWNPDFPKTKEAIEWFFKEGEIAPVDGMIAINLIPILDIISILGPLDIPDYNLKLTADNFYQETQAEVETDFFPGSTQKRDFLGAAGKEVLKTIGNDTSKLKTLLPVIYRNLESNQILVSIDNPGADSFFKAMHWSGALEPVGQDDYVFWNEANMGSNKTNCCVDRSFRDEIALTPDRLSHTWTLYFKNNNPGTPAPPLHFGGGYKNYMRLFIPKDSVLDGISIDAKPVAESMIDSETLEDKLSIGFLIGTGGGEESTVIVTYHRPHDAKKPYVLKMQKQSGIESIPLSINFNGKLLTPNTFNLTGFETFSE